MKFEIAISTSFQQIQDTLGVTIKNTSGSEAWDLLAARGKLIPAIRWINGVIEVFESQISISPEPFLPLDDIGVSLPGEDHRLMEVPVYTSGWSENFLNFPAVIPCSSINARYPAMEIFFLPAIQIVPWVPRDKNARALSILTIQKFDQMRGDLLKTPFMLSGPEALKFINPQMNQARYNLLHLSALKINKGLCSSE